MSKDKDFENLDPSGRLGNQAVQAKYKVMMTEIVRGIDQIFNGDKKGDARETGFVLLVFPYGDREGRTNYMSNGANRADVVRMFEEQIRRFKTDSDDDTPFLKAAALALGGSLEAAGIMLDQHHPDADTVLMDCAAEFLTLYRAGPEQWQGLIDEFRQRRKQ